MLTARSASAARAPTLATAAFVVARQASSQIFRSAYLCLSAW